jgi:hypothetical protein
MTEKKRRIHRRITKKKLFKGGVKNFFCRDIVKAYKNKVIYLGVNLNWTNLFPEFSYDLNWNNSTGTPSITFTMPTSIATPIVFDMTKPNDYSKIDDAIEIYLKPDGVNSKWNDDNQKDSNFKYILNNVILPRYPNNNNTQIGEISSPFLYWKKESGIVSNTNQIEDEQKNVILTSDKTNEKSMMLLVHEKLLEFKSKMKRVLIDAFKQRVRKNIQNIMDIMIAIPSGIIKRKCQFSVSGIIYFGIKVVCNSYTNFQLHELIITDPIVPVLDNLPNQENFPDLRTAVIKKFLSQNEENIKIHMEDLDGLLMFGSVKASTPTDGKRGNYGKHNIYFNDNPDNPIKDYNPESAKIFEILRKI